MDKLNLNKRLNGLTTPYPDQAYDLDGDGSVTGVDKLQMNRVLNGLMIP